jgi:IS605 OrfB family transposase
MAFKSKNLFNSALYICRQAFFALRPVPGFNRLYHQLKTEEDYKALPSKVAQLVFKQVDKCFKSYFEAKKAWLADPSKFLGEPRIPNYKDKDKGRNLLIFNNQAFSKTWLKKGFIKASSLNLKVKTKLTKIEEVRIIPKGNVYVIEAIYEREVACAEVSSAPSDCREEAPIISGDKIASIDIGLNNLATVASNDPNFKPFIVCGKALKACNQQYNKVKSKLQSYLSEKQYTSRRIEALTLKRNNKVDYYLHTASSFIIKQLVSQGVTQLIIGKNDNWKQNINLGRRTNQNFTNIPHARFIQQLEYKALIVGIGVTIVEESYTSKCSFLDLEPIKKQQNYLGKRVKRGLFRSTSGKSYSADLNGALNIMRKVVGDAIFDSNSIERLVVSPLRFTPYKA